MPHLYLTREICLKSRHACGVLTAHMDAGPNSDLVAKFDNAALNAVIAACTEAARPGWERFACSFYALLHIMEFWRWERALEVLKAGRRLRIQTATWILESRFVLTAWHLVVMGLAKQGRGKPQCSSCSLRSSSPMAECIGTARGDDTCNRRVPASLSICVRGPG